MDYQKEFKRLSDKYISPKEYETIYIDARDLIEDLQFLFVLMGRIKKSKFDFKPIATINNSIRGMFLSNLSFACMGSSYNTIEHWVDLLKIYEIAKKIFDKLNKLGNSIERKDIIELLTLDSVCYYYTKIHLTEHVGSFIGCSKSVGAIDECIHKALLNNKEVK